MRSARTLAVARKVVRGIRRDRRTLALMLVAPIVAMLVFGFVFGTEIRDVPTAIVDEDEGPLGSQIAANLSTTTFRATWIADWESAKRGVRDGTYDAAIRFPRDLSRNSSVVPPSGGLPVGVPGVPGGAPSPPPGATIELYVEGTNSQVTASVSRALLEAAQETLAGRTGGRLPVSVDRDAAYAEGADYMDFFVPGIMAFAALMFTTLITVLAFVGERTTGTLARLLVTPVTAGEIVTGYALAFSVVAVLQGVLLLSVAVLVFRVLVAGSILLVLLVVGLMAIDAMSLGILMSAAAKRESQAVQLFPLVAFPTFLLAGIFIPVESLPPYLAPFAWTIPPTYAVEALRSVMLRGGGLADVGWHLLALAGFAAGFLALSVATLRRNRAT